MQNRSNSDDYMIRGIAGNNEIRCFAVTGRELVEKARAAHGTSPVATAALGRTMMGALMMSDMLKNDEDLLTIRFDGDGPLGSIVVTADHHGNVKGYVQQPSGEESLFHPVCDRDAGRRHDSGGYAAGGVKGLR